MRFLLYFLLLAAPAWANPAGGDAQGLPHTRGESAGLPVAGDADFLAAHDAYLAGNTAKLGRYAQRLKISPLEVYASYYQLSLGIDNADKKPAPRKEKDHAPGTLEAAVKTFLSRPEDTPIIDQLRSEWLKLLGKRQQWDQFDAEYPRLLSEDTDLNCYALQSRRRTQEQAALREARKLWFTGKGQPDSCGPLFDAALSAGIITEHDIAQRLRLSLEANNVTFAAQLAKELAGEYSGLPGLLKNAAADPERYLKKLGPNDSNSPAGSATASAQTDVSSALANWSSDDEQRRASGVTLDIPAAIPGAGAPSASSGWPRWGNLLSRLGFDKAGDPLPASAYYGLTPLTDIRPARTFDPACQPPCVDIGDTDAVPPMGWSPKLTSKAQRMVALFALERLANESPELAYTRWAKIAGYFPLSEQHYFYGRLAYQAARDLDPRALQWYRAAADTPLDDRQSAWRVRAALRVQDWQEVLAAVNAMSEQQQLDGAWQYWKARALQALGKPAEARAIFASLSADFNFYGQLASSELADPVMSEAKPVYKPDQQAIDAVSALPGVQRTLALYRMGLRNEALEEWRWVLRNLNDRELLTAAEIALRNKMYDRAIGAAEKTVAMHDLSLRYLAPYRADLQVHIREHNLDEAWVYGLMRQESRFTPSAKSEVGAAGLMQIMPSTARWAANKLGLKSYRQALIHQLDTNLRLGTYYMKAILSQSENSPVLASAAYNAGPTRALQWRGDRPMEGAIYTETIPYEETRDYVKKVMSNSVYYAAQFGDPPRSLKQRLGIVPGKTPDNTASDDQGAPANVP